MGSNNLLKALYRNISKSIFINLMCYLSLTSVMKSKTVPKLQNIMLNKSRLILPKIVHNSFIMMLITSPWSRCSCLHCEATTASTSQATTIQRPCYSRNFVKLLSPWNAARHQTTLDLGSNCSVQISTLIRTSCHSCSIGGGKVCLLQFVHINTIDSCCSHQKLKVA